MLREDDTHHLLALLRIVDSDGTHSTRKPTFWGVRIISQTCWAGWFYRYAVLTADAREISSALWLPLDGKQSLHIGQRLVAIYDQS